MKKEKIMLVAIAAMALVGGIFAFKAANFHPKHLRCYTTGAGVVSTCSFTIYTTAPIPGGVTTNAPCGKAFLHDPTFFYTNTDTLCTNSFSPLGQTFTVADAQ